MRRTTSTMLAAVAATATVVTLAPPAAAARSLGVETIHYGSHVRQVMDVYTPAKAVGKKGQKRGTIVLIHGGSWIKGDKSDFAPQARQLARRGYVVANINYRYATDARWPAPRTDSVNAVKYLRSHARSLNVDNNRIILIGSSAGAHLATSVATLGRGSKLVSGVIGLSGPLGLKRTAAAPSNLGTVVTDLLLGCDPSECAGRYDAATPKNRLSRGDVPSLLFSSRNELVNPRNSVDFVRKAKRIGLSSRMVWIPGNLHARYYWDRAWPTIDAWVKKQMKK